MENGYEREPHYMDGYSKGIYINCHVSGDKYNPAKKLLVNRKYLKNFEAFLDYATETVKPYFGAIRDVVTPLGVDKIDAVEKLVPGGRYIVCGGCTTNKYKRIDRGYSQIKDPYSPRHGRGRAHKIDPLGFRRLNNLYSDVQPRYLIQEPSHRPEKYIFVYENHNDVEKPRKVLLYNCSTMNKVIYDVHNVIAEDIKDTVRGLWDMDGVEITEPSMLENGGYYVAKGSRSPNDEFATNCHYRPAGCRPFDVPAHSPRDSNPYKGVSYMWQLPGNSAKRPRTLPHIHQSRVKKPSPDHSHHSEPQSQRRSNRQVLDPIQQQQNRTKKKKADYDKDDGGVFKAKGQNKYTRGANEVNDSRNMKVDLPIDQVRAEEVQEEKIRKEKQSKEVNNRSQKQAEHKHSKVPNGNRYDGKGEQSNSKTSVNNSQSKTSQNSTFKSNSKAPPPDQQYKASVKNSDTKNEAKKQTSPVQNKNFNNHDPVGKSSPKGQAKSPQPKTSTPTDNKKVPTPVEEHEAATKIQANYRGHKARQEVNDLKTKKEDEQRKKKDDAERAKQAAEENAAATKIQAGFRGHQARKEVNAKKQGKQ